MGSVQKSIYPTKDRGNFRHTPREIRAANFSAPTDAYHQHDDSLPVAATFDSNDNNGLIEVVGQVVTARTLGN